MPAMRRAAALVSCLLMACATGSAWAQSPGPETQARIRQATRSALNTFLAAGLPALQKSIVSCYDKAGIQTDANALFLETEKCTATDQLGLIIFIAEKRRTTQAGEPFDHVFLNPDAHRARVSAFWAAHGMDAPTRDQTVNAIFSVVYDEFVLQLPGIAMPAPRPPAAIPASASSSPPRSTPTSP